MLVKAVRARVVKQYTNKSSNERLHRKVKARLAGNQSCDSCMKCNNKYCGKFLKNHNDQPTVNGYFVLCTFRTCWPCCYYVTCPEREMERQKHKYSTRKVVTANVTSTRLYLGSFVCLTLFHLVLVHQFYFKR